MTVSSNWFANEYDDENDIQTHNHQNRELLFYRYVAEGNIEAIQENIANHEFLNPNGIGRL